MRTTPNTHRKIDTAVVDFYNVTCQPNATKRQTGELRLELTTQLILGRRLNINVSRRGLSIAGALLEPIRTGSVVGATKGVSDDRHV